MGTLKLRRESALNLTLEGSIGSFSVGTGQKGQNSIEVKYFLTHVGLDFSSGSDEALLSHLAPVREIFDLEQLDFNEIMQRDIDDARVSSELIPYLLDEKSRDLVKLFPPIVVVVLPVKEGENRPDHLYPEVTEEQKPADQDDEPDTYIMRAGSIGKEVFQFEQPIDEEGKRLKHDLVRFRLNTLKTRLVIVDGQHRAMALLALYRNIKEQWSDEKRAPFKDYYSEWTPKYIQQFNLKEINLPIILCTFPSLDAEYKGEYDIRQAARSIFLTLNRDARQVSRTRNILLDDKDIIAYFLRRCLSEIKNKDSRSEYSLRIFNVELDQSDKDKLKIQSPIAITGVNHLYYIIEHLLLNKGNEDVNGVKARRGTFSSRKDLNLNCMERLDGRNLIGADLADLTKRDNFTLDAAQKLGENFDRRYGKLIITLFEKFSPYENHNRAVLTLESDIESDQDRRLRPILFSGQGIGRVFESHRENLKQKLKEGSFTTKVPEIEAIAQRFDQTTKRVDQAIERFRGERAELYLKLVSDKREIKDSTTNKIISEIVKWINDLYDNVLTTVAFQSALICGFLDEMEKVKAQLDTANQGSIDEEQCFCKYLDQINDFFTPKTSSQFKKLVSVFTGEISGKITDWTITPTNQTFRNVVYRGEMNPNEWPKYKYLLLEIWKPEQEMISKVVENTRQECRKQIFTVLYNYYKSLYCRENSKLEDQLSNSDRDSIFNKVFSDYSGFVKTIGAEKLDETEMKKAASDVAASVMDDDSEDED